MADTGAYLLLGLAVVAIIMTAFIVSMFVRYRNAQRDLELLEQLQEED